MPFPRDLVAATGYEVGQSDSTFGSATAGGHENLYYSAGTYMVDNYANATLLAPPNSTYGLNDNGYPVVWDNHPGSTFTIADSAYIQSNAASQFIITETLDGNT